MEEAQFYFIFIKCYNQERERGEGWEMAEKKIGVSFYLTIRIE
jgi:hypothetical protein